MAIHIIPDSGSLHFFARPLNDKGNQSLRTLQIIGWAVDDKTMKPEPVVYPALKEGEELVYKSERGLMEVK